MATIEYSLFRVKFIKPNQKSFLHTDLTPGELFLKTLAERPSAELRKGYRWHIGNLKYFSETTGYFAIGRTTNSKIEVFDDQSGDFVEEELEESPYTHCVFNAEIGFVGIAKKMPLGQTAKGLAARIQQLLATGQAIAENEINVEIVPIPDPEGFIKILASAYRVFRFSATFRGPNPFDADAYFQRPLAVYLNAAGGDKGKTSIQGEDLDREVLQEVTRSTAATGNEASARIVKSRSQRPMTINLKGDPVKRVYEESLHNPEVVLADLTNIYHRIRNDTKDRN